MPGDTESARPTTLGNTPVGLADSAAQDASSRLPASECTDR